MSIKKINEEAAVFGTNEGPVLDVVTPEGFSVTIREWNGEDEDAISKLKDNDDGTAVYKFLSGVVIAVNGVKSVLDWKDVAKWKVRTIYYLLYKSRVFTYGTKLAWEHAFENGEKHPFIEDLAKFDWDLGKDHPPTKGQEGYSPDIIQPYKTTTEWVESTTSTQKKYRFKLLTGEDELMNRGLDVTNLSINDKLRIRSFQLNLNGSWVQVERFNVLRAIETNEIRNKVDELDGEFNLLTTVKTPKGVTEQISLIATPDFFFPQS